MYPNIYRKHCFVHFGLLLLRALAWEVAWFYGRCCIDGRAVFLLPSYLLSFCGHSSNVLPIIPAFLELEELFCCSFKLAETSSLSIDLYRALILGFGREWCYCHHSSYNNNRPTRHMIRCFRKYAAPCF